MTASEAAREINTLLQVDGEIVIDLDVLTEIIQGDLTASGQPITSWVCTHIVAGSLPEDKIAHYKDTWDYIGSLV